MPNGEVGVKVKCANTHPVRLFSLMTLSCCWKLFQIGLFVVCVATVLAAILQLLCSKHGGSERWRPALMNCSYTDSENFPHTRSGLAVDRLTKHKLNQAEAKYDHTAQISGNSGILMFQKSKTKRTNKHKQALDFYFKTPHVSWIKICFTPFHLQNHKPWEREQDQTISVWSHGLCC